MDISATGQAYGRLRLRLYSSPLPEAREYADMILAEVKAVMPSFVARVERPDRGGEWVDYLRERDAAAARWSARLGLDRPSVEGGDGPSGRLLPVDRDGGAPAAPPPVAATRASEEGNG